jgi:SsrA-binding protein
MADAPIKLIVDNRRARFNFELLEKLEAGIVLKGTEVKSLRAGKLNLGDSYVDVTREGEVFLVGAHISPYAAGNRFNVEPMRARKLLLHNREIQRVGARIRERGLTLVPTRVYFKKGMVKVEIALARGKKLHDKRDTIKTRDSVREARQALSRKGPPRSSVE